MLEFRLGATCYLTGGLSTINQVFNNDISLPELDDFSLEDCGCWQSLIFEEGESAVIIDICDSEDTDELIADLNKFSGSSLDDLKKYLKKKRIDFDQCPNY